MPETPDFGHLARQLIVRVCEEMPHIAAPGLVDDLVEQLRRVWNARGAADRALLDAALAHTMAPELSRAKFDANALTAAITQLDR